jgi:hypothetical protein
MTSPKPASPHHLLASLSGHWQGLTRTWFEPGALADESFIQGSIQPILDGRFIIFIYQSAMQGVPLHGMYTFGYNTLLDRYEASWIDSFHNNTAIMFCTGAGTEQGFSVLGSYPNPDGGPDWGWRTALDIIDENHLRLTAYNFLPDGQEYKALETKLERSK